MAVKAVVLDLDGTLLTPQGNPVPGISEMIAELRALGLKIAVASNQSRAAQKLARAALSADFIVDKAMTGINKGSHLWTERVIQEFQIESNEVVWLGDSDRDMRSAVNAKIIYFNAGWSEPNYPYGINLPAPSLLPLFLREFFLKPISWYWQLSTVDNQGQRVTVKAIMDANGAGIPVLKNDLVSFLKDGGNPRVGPMLVRSFLFLHLVGSVFGDQFYHQADFWTVYPSSRGGPNAALGQLTTLVARLFRDRYLADLLVRHTQSVDSGEARRRGEQVFFDNQSDTMLLNPAYRQKVQGKCVVILDDFTTHGYSAECARLLLLEAGAAEVVCINVGKYGSNHSVISTALDYTWDPCFATQHPPRSFRGNLMSGQTDPSALTVIRESYRRVHALGRATRG